MLSVSREAITAVTISPRGDWVALGCAALGQLLVWEWRSESYVLKQQGHHYDVSALAFSPDGAYIATGADDNKVPHITYARSPKLFFAGFSSVIGCHPPPL